MPKTKIFLAISILILSAIACNALSPSAQRDLPRTEDDVPRVDVATAKAALDSGAAIIVDVRSRAAYSESHVPNALSIPLDEFELNIESVNLEKGQWIITYCT